jgi:hypothetical protein
MLFLRGFACLPVFSDPCAADADAPFVLWWGNTPMVAITHPEDAKCVMTADVKHFKVVEAFRKPFLPLLGNGLLLAEEETWQHHRAIMKPAFFAERLKVNRNSALSQKPSNSRAFLDDFYTLLALGGFCFGANKKKKKVALLSYLCL